jgi:putative nucleotidyltransferase with HDIG domain
MARPQLWTEPKTTSFDLFGRLLGTLRSPRFRRLVTASALTGALLLASGLIIESAGGGNTPFVHLFYIPVLVAAVAFGSWGGLAAGLVAGAVSAPAVMGAAETGAAWALRTVILSGIGFAFGYGHELLQRRLGQCDHLLKKISTIHARTLSTFASTVDLRDKPTSGHSSRVAHNARALGMALGLAQETLRAVYWAGLLHDLGKIAVPERILQKPGTLSADEMVTMRRHSDIGANLLMSVSADLRQIADGVRSHHERWDGSGYPGQVRGDAIPLVGRIVSVVDVFEALTCKRPYRQPQPVSEVLEFVRYRSGTWFDPELVPILEDLYWQGEIFTAASVDTQLPVEEPVSIEEPPIVIDNDDGRRSIVRATRRGDYHLGSSGRP